MNTKNTKLYFVALIPPAEVCDRVLKLKQEVAEKFGSKAALKSPPHITLHMPFNFKENKEDKLNNVLGSFAMQQQPMLIRQEGFASFAPRVIYISVEKTDELKHFRSDLVREMRRGLNLDNADYKDQAFHPHMTIAFRDLKKSIFPEAWMYYKDQEFHEEWNCDRLALLKHNGKTWDIYEKYAIGSQMLDFGPLD